MLLKIVSDCDYLQNFYNRKYFQELNYFYTLREALK